MKIGDRVRIVHSKYTSVALQPGNEGCIEGEFNANLWSVRMDTSVPGPFGGPDWAFWTYELEVVQS